MPTLQPTKSYVTLKNQIQQTFVLAQKRIEEERVKTYWQTGELLHKHILSNKKAAYGENLILRLAEDLEVDKTILHRTLRFYRFFPKVARGQLLTWSHYRNLIAIQDSKLRESLARQAVKQGWTYPQLVEEIKRRVGESPRALASPQSKLKPPVLGPIYHYRMIEEKNDQEGKSALYVDLGFGTHLPAEMFELRNVKAGGVVQAVKEAQGTYALRKTMKVTLKEIFTYRAYSLRVIDGDTLWMHVDLGFGVRKKVKIRLKGIDTPAVATPKGKKAKAFLERLVRESSALTLKSTRAGKFDRYLGDLFLEGGEYMNQQLIRGGLPRGCLANPILPWPTNLTRCKIMT